MRITDQYLWNFIFAVFFAVLVIMATIILQSEATRPWSALTLADYVIITLASFRVIRLMTYDKITAFFRDQFWDVRETRGGEVLVKPESGPRRTVADLLSCPWCFGVWASATVIFFYMLTPYAYFPILMLAIAGAATMLQLLANLVGWHAEKCKLDVEMR